MIKLQRTTDTFNSGIEFYNSSNTAQGGLFLTGLNTDLNFTSTWGTPGYFIQRSTSRFGIGTYVPKGKVGIAANSSAEEATLALEETSTTVGARLAFKNYNSTDFQLFGNPGNSAATSIFNIYHSTGGNLMSIKGDGEIQHTGYTSLGTDAPKIKMKKLTGTTAPAEGGTVDIVHGLNQDKILAVSIFVVGVGSYLEPPNFTSFGGSQFEYDISSTRIYVNNIAGKSGNILSKDIRILITYEE